ncbi:methionine ABC transporter ATP-binding protein [Peptoniphilus sp. KCTC 25270]|uniref:methionine ABC transporter ATP-binding protein n=1 Tax=Peptoniphilus sp. KCTC 25270 TaxID=2897414 RepID=UPI001E5646D7|nr:methionine ABC transporter ATP-binding protein [Peptoniphilus sp. KCTC 25270]MCD1147283.1 methionine ABC transporter ATP-binding protein [Peptoniphilus sp. KCTC 25270]
MIELKNITVDFDHVIAVDDVDITIEKGDVYGIVGFSGAGKSTLVRTINLLQRPTVGEVHVLGENLMELSPKALREKRKEIGMIFQNFNLLSHRTVLDNVLYPIRKSALSKEEKRTKALRLLKLVGIEEKADHYPNQLSGGQQQRCAIARSLASDPSILLCDEATSALDPKTTKQILKLLKTVNEELGITIVIITHQMEVVKEICNKCAIMQEGKIIERGSTLEIFSQPKTPLAKEFVETSTDYGETLEKVRKNLIRLKENEVLATIRYVGESATEPTIHQLYETLGVTTNILAGNIELITGTPVGNLIVSLEGKRENLKAAKEFMASKGANLNIVGGIHGVL